MSHFRLISKTRLPQRGSLDCTVCLLIAGLDRCREKGKCEFTRLDGLT